MIKNIFKFSQLTFFRQIANQLSIRIPIINQEINLDIDQQCEIFGLLKKKHQDDECFNYVKDGREILKFGDAMKVGSVLKMDICALNLENSIPVLSLSPLKQQIYRQYMKQLVKSRIKFKEIRIGYNIQQNDMLNKANSVKKMSLDAKNRFKIVTPDDSQKSYKVLEIFNRLIQKEFNIQIQEQKQLKGKIKRKWITYYDFSETAPIDVDYINKKWRQKKLKQKFPSKQPSLNDLVKSETVQVQRQYIHLLQQAGIGLPKQYQYLNQIQNDIANEQFFTNLENLEQIKRQQQNQNRRQQQTKQAEKYFRLRKVEEIVAQMQKMKQSYSLQPYQQVKYRKLEEELRSIIEEGK